MKKPRKRKKTLEEWRQSGKLMRASELLSRLGDTRSTQQSVDAHKR